MTFFQWDSRGSGNEARPLAVHVHLARGDQDDSPHRPGGLLRHHRPAVSAGAGARRERRASLCREGSASGESRCGGETSVNVPSLKCFDVARVRTDWDSDYGPRMLVKIVNTRSRVIIAWFNVSFN